MRSIESRDLCYRLSSQKRARRRAKWQVCLLATLCASAEAVAAPAPTWSAMAGNRRCLECHGQPQITTYSADKRAGMVSTPAPEPRQDTSGLYFDQERFGQSAHSGLACSDCHSDSAELPHPARRPEPTCGAADCHPLEADRYLRGVHAEKRAEGDRDSPQCWTCHGGHEILPPTERESLTYPLSVVAVCTSCHEQRGPTASVPESGRQLVQHYLDSVHGRAVERGGMVVAATCPQCHRAHDVRPSRDAGSSTHRGQIPQTCGECHVGVCEVYGTSIHGQKLAEGDENAPVCTDCHTAHAITQSSTPAFTLDIVNECGTCHDKPTRAGRTSFYKTYRESYHGQITRLGYTLAARCSDCHGAHDIRTIADPKSQLHGENRINVCRSKDCHPGADARLAQFECHADYRDGERYPLLYAIWLYFIIVMSGAFGFYGLHSLLWLTRSIIERVKHGPHPRPAANSPAIMRFTRADRVNHAFVIITFFGLTLTGLPLRFADHEWARGLAFLLGGGNMAGILHRIFAVMLAGNFVAHFAVLVKRRRPCKLWRHRLFGPNTMLPRVKDVKDCLGMFRWFFRGGSKPAFDRWTYWEKFDYAAEVFGSLIIGGSGLLLWFPVFFSGFLPGWMFNVAMIVHGYEALLALGFIFTIHFFNAHLRLEKFPVDDVIFTGCLPEEEFKHERPVEYARAVATGELETLRVPPPPPWQRKMAILVGIVAMSVGMTLVVLIVLAGLGVL